MDPNTAAAALAAMDTRRRGSRRALIVVNSLLVLGLAGFFLARELRCDSVADIMPAR